MQANNILVRMPNWLGDMVMATPFLEVLAALYPGAAIDVIVKKGLDELAAHLPVRGAVYVFSKAEYRGLAGAWRFGKKIAAAKKYDLFFCLPDSFSSAVMGMATGAAQRVGYKKELRSLLLSRSYTKNSTQHRVEVYIQLLRYFSGRNIPAPAVRLTVPGVQKEYTLVININSEAASRRLPEDKAVSLLNMVRQHTDCRIVLVGAPGEKPFIDSVYNRLADKNGFENLAGTTTLNGLLHLLAASTAILTTDSGPAHLGNAAGTHTVVLTGAGNEAETAPFNPWKTIIRLGKLPCEPCVSNVCKKFNIPRCLTLLDELAVTQAVTVLLKKNADLTQKK